MQGSPAQQESRTLSRIQATNCTYLYSARWCFHPFLINQWKLWSRWWKLAHQLRERADFYAFERNLLLLAQRLALSNGAHEEGQPHQDEEETHEDDEEGKSHEDDEEEAHEGGGRGDGFDG